MQLGIDAWLERREPRIRLFDQESGREILRIGPDQVRELMASGDLSLPDIATEAIHSNDLLDLLYQRLAEQHDPCCRRLPAYMGRRKPRQSTEDYPVPHQESSHV